MEITMPLLDEMLREQLKVWPLAANNYMALGTTKRRKFRIDGLVGAFQCNPARIVSTAAKTDSKSVAERPCFLCSTNRPEEQYAIPFEVAGGGRWEVLVNPYPILPWHFTVVSAEHKPQGDIPLDMIVMAEKLPEAVVFYNGAKAGASAPDHLHFQMVLKRELPLINYLEDGKPLDNLPYKVKYWKVSPDSAGMRMIREFASSTGIDPTTGRQDMTRVNAFAWMGEDGLLRLAVVPRTVHRPKCYFAGEDTRMLISPGAIDVAGLIVIPRTEDFDRITPEDLRQIYEDTMISVER